MRRSYGKILEDRKELRKWFLLQRQMNLPDELYMLSLSFATIIEMHCTVLVDDDSIKHEFRNQDGQLLIKYRHVITNGPDTSVTKDENVNVFDTYDNKVSKNAHKYTYTALMTNRLNWHSTMCIVYDVLIGKDCVIGQVELLSKYLISPYLEKTLYNNTTLDYIFLQYKKYPEIKQKRYINRIVFNTKWTLEDVIHNDLDIKKTRDDIEIPVFDDTDSNQYVCVSAIRKIMGHNDTNHTLRHRSTPLQFRRGVDFAQRCEISFDDPKKVGSLYRSKDTYFIKITALPAYLFFSVEFQYKILAAFVMRLICTEV